MRQYIICLKRKGSQSVHIHQCHSPHNASQSVEDIAIDTVLNVEGDKYLKSKVFFEESVSGLYGRHPFGHFLVKSGPMKYRIYNKTSHRNMIGFQYIRIKKIATVYAILINRIKPQYTYGKLINEARIDEEIYVNLMEELLDQTDLILEETDD
ncbi:MAG: hypothetical protein ACTSRK_18280 [Promethearchaeota archaeon]